MMEKTARQLVDSAPVENEKGKQRGPIFVCQRSFQGSEWMIRGEHKAPIESSKDSEGVFFFFFFSARKQIKRQHRFSALFRYIGDIPSHGFTFNPILDHEK